MKALLEWVWESVGGVRLDIGNIDNFFRVFCCKGKIEIEEWLEGENGVQREFYLFLKTEEIIIYTNRKGPGKFDTGGKEENYWDGIIGWMSTSDWSKIGIQRVRL